MSNLKETAEKLFAAARRLNEATDELNDQVANLNARLKAMNIGIPAWHKINDTLQIGYAKSPEWGITISQGLDLWPFAKAPRKLRLEVVDYFPFVLQALATAASRMSAKLETDLEFLEQFYKEGNVK